LSAAIFGRYASTWVDKPEERKGKGKEGVVGMEISIVEREGRSIRKSHALFKW